MNYTTESFQTGSEFRVQTVDVTYHSRPKRGHMETISTKYSETFATYEEAVAHADTLNSESKRIQVKSPGNKRFTSTWNAKKA